MKTDNRKRSFVKPFVKWAGGKSQLLNIIADFIPKRFNSIPFTYIEPFVGGGAMFFWMIENYPNIKKAVINDINTDLINTYISIKNDINKLIKILKTWEKEYHLLENKPKEKEDYYYLKRTLFNKRTSDTTVQSALFIFLNRTCFNGLYRVNKKNEFNVPIGKYKKPMICDNKNLINVSKVLKNVIIINEDFEKTLEYAETNTIFYLDPPYKPLSNTSNFNSYAKNQFDDEEQKRLAKFCEQIDMFGHTWILSNSDLKNVDQNNEFFDKLYNKFNINRVLAKRYINSNPNKRGELTELLITNYNNEKIISIAQ